MNKGFFPSYASQLMKCLKDMDFSAIEKLSKVFEAALRSERTIYLCGNGGSAANAIHLANDFLYPVAREGGRGFKVMALPANQAVLTCLANDIGYDKIFSFQIETMGKKGDVLLVLSGSGNSANIVKAVEAARKKGMISCAILGYDGGQCLKMVDVAVHVVVNDMQISEDMQLVVGHMLMQWLCKKAERRDR